MRYFSYGSNMSIKRLLARTPSADTIAVATLRGHELRFHKFGKDSSGKCDAFKTGDAGSSIIGVIYEIDGSEKAALDKAEGLGFGYEEKGITVTTTEGEPVDAVTYYATDIDPSLKPYHWYKEHVMLGARENCFPQDYIQAIADIESIDDPDPKRHEKEMAIYQ